MPTPVGVTTLEELRTWTRSASGVENDALLTRLGQAASQAVQEFLGRTISASAGYTERYSGSGMPILALKRHPILAVTAISTEGGVLDADTYRVDIETGVIYRIGSTLDEELPSPVWPEGYLNLIVTYTAPADGGLSASQKKVAEQAVLMWVSMLLAQRGTVDTTLKSERLGDYAYERFSGAEGISTAGIPPAVTALLAPLKRWAVA